MKPFRKFSLLSLLGILASACGSMKSSCYSKECNTNPKTKTTIQDFKTDTSNKIPVVCQFVGEDFIERKAMLQKDIFSKIVQVTELENGYLFYFKYNDDFYVNLSNYVMTENKCCPFFTFHIRLHAQEDIQLQVVGSKEAKEMIKAEILDYLND